jgi:class 3 adenylate cyclase
MVEMIENQQSLFYKKKSEVISLEKKNLTIVFWDLGFSTFFNLIKSQYEITLFLEQYFGLADQFIHKFNDILNKFIGDGILVSFGLVTAKSDNSLGAIDAVNCAIELRNIFGKMKSNWIKLWHLHFGYVDMKIDLKCGINSGEVLFGRLGTDNRDEITVIGRVVNLASRWNVGQD